VELPLTRRTIYILPTRQGFAYAGALAVMLIGAANYGNSLGYALAFLLVAVAIVSLLHTYRNLAGLTVTLTAPSPVHAGTPARIVLRLENHDGPLRRALAATVPTRVPVTLEETGQTPSGRRKRPWNPIGRRAKAHRERRTEYLDVPAGAARALSVEIETIARGEHAVGPVVIATRFPLGLFRAWTPLTSSTRRPEIRCLVYPRLAGRRTLPDPSLASRGSTGPLGTGEEDFSGLRAYQRGDSPKRIHWKAVARAVAPLACSHGGARADPDAARAWLELLPVKTFSGAERGMVMLEWEQTAHLPDPESRLSQLSMWIECASALGLAYSLTLPGFALPGDIGP